MRHQWKYATPLGGIALVAEDEAIVGLYFEEQAVPDAQALETELLRLAGVQLREYFAGRRREFDLPLAPSGTKFQLADWQALRTIPYGQTRTYGQIAAQLGRPKACRAVGLANRNNPISIIIPCHRVIGANGKLVGYGGGLSRKQTLLDLEQKFS